MTNLESPPPRRIFAPDLMAGQVALVTGGGTGLGRSIANALADAGADLLLAARRIEPLEQAAAEIRAATGRRVEVAVCNIRERDQVEALAATAAERFGGQIDVLVNNAGGQFPTPARSMKPKGWNAVIDLNLNGTWNMIQTFGNQMLDGRGGAIVNVIAVIGRGFPGLAHTSAARAGVAELTRTLAFEWGTRVRINCIAPGAVRTAGFDKAGYEIKTSPVVRQQPIPRFGTPHEVAYGVVFLASPASTFITGEVLNVSGGQHLYGLNQGLQDESFERPPRGPSVDGDT